MSTESRELPELVARWERQIKFACGKKDRMNDAQRTTMQECLDDLKAALANSRAQDSGGEADTHFVDGLGWVVPCRDAVAYVRKLIVARNDLAAEVDAEQPAKGEGACRCTSSDPWDCIRTDDLAGLPCFCKCHTAAQQPSDPADAVEAVKLTRCCGREECGGECGNEWRGEEWVRVRKQSLDRDESATLLAFADRIEKAEPYIRNSTITRWCADLVRDMREAATPPAAPQPSDPADDDFDVLYAAEPDSKQAIKGICRYWYERGRAVTPPTAQRNDDGARDAGGRIVREAWVKWALTQPNPKPSWLTPYDELSEPDKEADRQIFEACVAHGAGAAVEAVPCVSAAVRACVSDLKRELSETDASHRLRAGTVRYYINKLEAALHPEQAKDGAAGCEESK